MRNQEIKRPSGTEQGARAVPGNELPGYFHPAPLGQRQANVLESAREDKNLPL